MYSVWTDVITGSWSLPQELSRVRHSTTAPSAGVASVWSLAYGVAAIVGLPSFRISKSLSEQS